MLLMLLDMLRVFGQRFQLFGVRCRIAHKPTGTIRFTIEREFDVSRRARRSPVLPGLQPVT